MPHTAVRRQGRFPVLSGPGNGRKQLRNRLRGRTRKDKSTQEQAAGKHAFSVPVTSHQCIYRTVTVKERRSIAWDKLG